MVPLTAAPIKGPLFDFLELDVDLTANMPAAAALQHLALCVLQPAWLVEDARNSSAPPPVHAATRAGFCRDCILHACAMRLRCKLQSTRKQCVTCALCSFAQLLTACASLANLVIAHAVLEAAPAPRESFRAASAAIESAAKPVSDMRTGLLDKEMVNKQRMDTITFSIGPADFHAVRPHP